MSRLPSANVYTYLADSVLVDPVLVDSLVTAFSLSPAAGHGGRTAARGKARALLPGGPHSPHSERKKAQDSPGATDSSPSPTATVIGDWAATGMRMLSRSVFRRTEMPQWPR
jgi:hypothetical protein